jgi:hypothetical protein
VFSNREGLKQNFPEGVSHTETKKTTQGELSKRLQKLGENGEKTHFCCGEKTTGEKNTQVWLINNSLLSRLQVFFSPR